MFKLSIQDINFIVYNNRSVKLVEQFLSTIDIDIKDFLIFENKIRFFRDLYKKSTGVDIKKEDINQTNNDIIYDITDINNITNIILESNKYIKNYPEYNYLIERGFTDDIITKYKLGALSHIKDKKVLDTLGVTIHPLLINILDNNLDDGAIIIPLFRNGKLINSNNRRISNIGKLKYTLACPEFDVWGLDEFNVNDEIWLTEGIFDKMALDINGKKAISVASATWSTIQLYRIIKKKPKRINIFSDYDYTGLRSSKLLQKIIRFFNIECGIYISKKYKDASEHFIKHNLTFNEIEEIAVTTEMLDEIGDDTLQNTQTSFLDYLKNRVY